MQPIGSLENIHAGEDIFVVGAGKSGDFIDPSFLDCRIAIGVNQAYKRFDNLTYTVKKDGITNHEAGLGMPFIVPEFQYGGAGKQNPDGDYFFKHNQNKNTDITMLDLHPDGGRFIVSFSTITSAIHIAAFMGARSIFLIGHDCGTLDGESSFTGYHTEKPNLWSSFDTYNDWLTKIEPQTALVRDYVLKNYNCNVYSINPFVSLRLEGHKLG